MNSYKNFSAAVYCPVGDLSGIDDFRQFERQFSHIEKNVRVEKVYLETHRGGQIVDREQMLRVKRFFEDRGIRTAGGITTEAAPDEQGGFHPFCYTDPQTRQQLTAISELTAGLFDEIILDDFYFTNCKCERCLAERGDQNWADFRLSLMRGISQNVIVGPAKRVNPKVKMVIKYPNWYEHYQECGYNLADEPDIFDGVYTGTETRNPTYTQQHLPKYLSYFTLRYLENAVPGRNGGGWFDPYECGYNLTSYAEQAYLTLLAGAKEAMLFSLGSLLHPDSTLFAPVAGQAFADMDGMLGKLGRPGGVACYLPFHCHGEDYLHGYIGMLGIPLEPFADYPESARSLFLTEGAAADGQIIEKVKTSLLGGADVIVSSGFVRATQDEFCSLANIHYTARKATVSRFAYSSDGDVCFGGCVTGEGEITLPQLEYPTNDTWELVGAFGYDNSFPVLLKTAFGAGRLFVLSVPDDCGGLYLLPREALSPIREAFCANTRVILDAPSMATLFSYDNESFVLRWFRPYMDTGRVNVSGNVRLLDPISGETLSGIFSGGKTVFDVKLLPGVNRLYRIISAS